LSETDNCSIGWCHYLLFFRFEVASFCQSCIYSSSFEGALRKWVLPQASEMIYFLKDVVLIGAYLNFYAFSVPKDKLLKKGGRQIVMF
jgi:hypothetical protein